MIVKSALIGAGFIGPSHVEAVRRLGFAEFKSLLDYSTEEAKKKAEILKIPHAASNLEEILKDPEITVVHICTPNNLHFNMALACINAGKHVICEKPLGLDSRQTSTLVTAAKKMDRINAVNFNYRFYPLVNEVKARMAKGELGTPHLIHGSYLQDWLLYETDYNWRVEPEIGGNLRAVGDIGSHWFDLVQFITGIKIKEVFADMATFLPIRKKPAKAQETFKGKEKAKKAALDIKIKTEDYASILLKFENGARGVLTVSQMSPGRKNRLWFEIDCSKKSVSWDQEDPERLWLGSREEANQLMMRDPSILSKTSRTYAHYPGGHPEGYADALKNFMEAVYGAVIKSEKMPAAPDFPTFEDGHRAIIICEATMKSFQEKRWIRIG